MILRVFIVNSPSLACTWTRTTQSNVWIIYWLNRSNLMCKIWMWEWESRTIYNEIPVNNFYVQQAIIILCHHHSIYTKLILSDNIDSIQRHQIIQKTRKIIISNLVIIVLMQLWKGSNFLLFVWAARSVVLLIHYDDLRLHHFHQLPVFFFVKK